MTPKFASMTEMINYMHTIPDTANYGKMIEDDFGVYAPDQENWQNQLLWKYMTQNLLKGVDFDSLMEQSMKNVDKLVKEMPYLAWPKINGEYVDPANAGIDVRTDVPAEMVESGQVNLGSKKGARVGTFDASKGECKVIKANGKYVAYIGDVMISNDANLKQLMKRFAAHGRGEFVYNEAA